MVLSNIDFASYTDDNTLHVVKDDTKEAIESLRHVTIALVYWFSDNQMKANSNKCHMITSSSNVESNSIKNSKRENPIQLTVLVS